MAEKILTGVKHIFFTPWNSEDNGLDTESRLELKNIIADTVAITQDDPDTSTIDCETRDEPIIESVTLGKYQVTMDSADIDYDILETCMGFSKIGDGTTVAAAAPTSYVKKYVCVEVEMEKAVFVLPRILLTSKLDASSLKTNVAKGTLSGSGYSAKCTVDSKTPVDTPFFVMEAGKQFTLAAI